VNAYRIPLILIPVSIAVGVVAALLGNWAVLAAMCVSLVVQLVNVWIIRGRGA
jgi:membrane protein YdbS with pleckstrin-like domain